MFLIVFKIFGLFLSKKGIPGVSHEQYLQAMRYQYQMNLQLQEKQRQEAQMRQLMLMQQQQQQQHHQQHQQNNIAHYGQPGPVGLSSNQQPRTVGDYTSNMNQYPQNVIIIIILKASFYMNIEMYRFRLGNGIK